MIKKLISSLKLKLVSKNVNNLPRLSLPSTNTQNINTPSTMTNKKLENNQEQIQITNSPLFDLDPLSIKNDMIKYLTLNQLPNDEQWEMILSNHRNVNVIAGAGSGKSTTLALRVIFLHKYLNISIEEIKIVTFTRNSKKDMVDKLIKNFKLFQLDFDEKLISKIVCTFHSLSIQQSTKGKNIFDLDGGNNAEINSLNSNNFNKLSSFQFRILKKIFLNLFNSNLEFQQNVENLISYKVSYEDTTQKDYKAYIKIEDEYLNLLENYWKDNGLEEIFKINRIKVNLNTIKDPIVLNGKLPDGRFLILLLPVNYLISNKLYNFKKAQENRIKCLMIIPDSFFILEDVNQIEKLNDILNRKTIKNKTLSAPMFYINNFGYTHILDYLYTEISYAESIGVKVNNIKPNLSNLSLNRDQYLVNLIKLFWIEMYNYFNANNITSFNKIFTELANQIDSDSYIDLSNMSHLMIDEFQDISPVIVDWIKTCKKETINGGSNGSLMCVGDDWQSIYGWRGSAPHFITNYQSEFGNSRYIVMNMNYRSTQAIINNAETMLSKVTDKTDTLIANGKSIKRKGVSVNGKQDDSQIIFKYDENTIINEVSKLFTNYDPEDIFLIYRTTTQMENFKKIIKDLLQQRKFKKEMTIHASKGLEASAVIVLDKIYKSSNHIRNYLLGISPLNNRMTNKTTYDSMQLEESYRLSYVAITRAKERCLYFYEL